MLVAAAPVAEVEAVAVAVEEAVAARYPPAAADPGCRDRLNIRPPGKHRQNLRGPRSEAGCCRHMHNGSNFAAALVEHSTAIDPDW